MIYKPIHVRVKINSQKNQKITILVLESVLLLFLRNCKKKQAEVTLTQG